MNESETILIIEDDAAMLRGLSDHFRFKGFQVHIAADGEDGLEKALNLRPSIIILDIMLPKMNGYEVCRLLREERLEMPILMLTAKGQESDIVLGLNLGADDYMTKPFSVRELTARVRAMLRRTRREEPASFRFGEYELDYQSRRLLRDGQELELTPKEFALLELFAHRRGRALTRRQILTAVWGYSVFVTERSVDRCVTTLRQKIEPDPRRPVLIRTVREIGYRFDAEDDAPES